MLTYTVILPASFYTDATVEQTISAFTHLCEADFRDQALMIRARDKYVIHEFLNYALCLSAKEQL